MAKVWPCSASLIQQPIKPLCNPVTTAVSTESRAPTNLFSARAVSQPMGQWGTNRCIQASRVRTRRWINRILSKQIRYRLYSRVPLLVDKWINNSQGVLIWGQTLIGLHLHVQIHLHLLIGGIRARMLCPVIWSTRLLQGLLIWVCSKTHKNLTSSKLGRLTTRNICATSPWIQVPWAVWLLMLQVFLKQPALQRRQTTSRSNQQLRVWRHLASLYLREGNVQRIIILQLIR